VRLPGQPPSLRRQLGEAARGRLGLALAQDAEAGPGDRAQHVRAVLLHQVIGPVADEGEVVVLDPLQQRPGLGQLGLVDRGRPLVQLGQDRADLLAHGRPVLDRGLDVRQDPLDLGPQPVQHLGLALAVDLEMQVRLADTVVGVGRQHLDQPAGLVAAHGDHRVDGQVDDQAVAVQLHGHRVDQERHVVGDDLHDRVPGAPAVLLEAGAVDPDLGLAGLAAVGQAPVGQDGAVQVVRFQLEQVLRGQALVVLAGELLDLLAPVLGHLLVDGRDNLLQDLRFRLLWLRRH
jgi:hypothetical protein